MIESTKAILKSSHKGEFMVEAYDFELDKGRHMELEETKKDNAFFEK